MTNTAYVLCYDYDERYDHPFRDPVEITVVEDVYADKALAETAKTRRSKRSPERRYYILERALKSDVGHGQSA